MGRVDNAGRPTERVLTAIAVLLTFASGASDVASFTRLGNVFTSVMTGNMVVFGLSLAHGSVTLAAHTVAAFAGYVLGVSVGSRIAWYHASGRSNRAPGPGPDADEWPPHITLTLLTEFALFALVVAGWEATGTRPSGVAQFVILVLAACAMGIQSAAVSQMGLGNVSTTYLTGTLTGLVSAVARPDSRAHLVGQSGVRRPAVLGGLLFGAVLAGVLIAPAFAGNAGAEAVPLLPLLAVGTAVLLCQQPRGTTRKPGRSRR